MQKDRARLVRGAGLRPVKQPYESVYRGVGQADMLVELKARYREAGLATASEMHEAADQIGFEFAFMSQLCLMELQEGNEQEAARLRDVRDSFVDMHLGQWAGAYGRAVAENADTGFFRGVGMLIEELHPPID